MGGIFHLPIVEGVDLPLTISRAKSMGYRIYVTELEGETHFDRVSYEGKTMVIFGNEAWGVSDQVSELADYRVSIRRYGQGESLNVSVACGIVLSAMHRLYD
jgi:TrmH family RNA methyltransferase